MKNELPPYTTPMLALEADTVLEHDAAGGSLPLVLPRPIDVPGRDLRRRARRDQRSDQPNSLRRNGLVSALSARNRVALSLTAGLWLASGVFLWSWWLEPGHQTTVAGWVVNSALLAFDVIVLPLWFFFFLLRIRRPDPALEVPRLRTAIIVTKAPSEPSELVRTTLEAMLAQDFSHPYELCLADEQLTDEAIDWCALHGLRMSTRDGVPSTTTRVGRDGSSARGKPRVPIRRLSRVRRRRSTRGLD